MNYPVDEVAINFAQPDALPIQSKLLRKNAVSFVLAFVQLCEITVALCNTELDSANGFPLIALNIRVSVRDLVLIKSKDILLAKPSVSMIRIRWDI